MMRGQSALVTKVTVGVTTPVLLLAARVNRAAAVLYNVTGTLQIKYGTDGTMPPWTMTLPSATSFIINNFTGQVLGLKLSGSSDVYVTDIW